MNSGKSAWQGRPNNWRFSLEAETEVGWKMIREGFAQMKEK